MATGTAAAQAARNRLQALNEGPADKADTRAAAALRAAGHPVTATSQSGLGTIASYRQGNINSIAQNLGYQGNQQQRAPVSTGSSGGSRGGGGGGGGGGGAAAPKLSQAQLDWMTGLLSGARPGALTANTLDLPDWNGPEVRPFDPTMYNQARTALNEGVTQDTATAQRATQDMLSYLGSNYTNAFNNPNSTYATAGQAPGMDQQAMARMLQSQGAGSQQAMQAYGQQQGQAGQADQAFGNLWRVLAGNEDQMQGNRMNNARQYGQQANDAITAAGRAGNLGINLGQGQAQAGWQQRADDRTYQNYGAQQQVLQNEAMNNWTRGNQVQDVNSTNTNSYNNATMQTLLGLLPQLQTNPALVLPTLQSLGLA